jgi:hypothetical protein
MKKNKRKKEKSGGEVTSDFLFCLEKLVEISSKI